MRPVILVPVYFAHVRVLCEQYPIIEIWTAHLERLHSRMICTINRPADKSRTQSNVSSIQSTNMNYSGSTDLARQEDCAARRLQPHVRCCSRPQHNLNTNLVDSNYISRYLQSGNLYSSWNSRLPCSLPSNIHDSVSRKSHATSIPSYVIRGPSATFALRGTRFCCPSHHPTASY